MQLFPDSSIIIQVILFIIIWAGLKRLILDPMSRVLNAREERTVGTEDFAAQLVAAAQTDRDEYEQAIRARRLEMAQESAVARQAAQAESNRALAAARAAATQELTKNRAALAVQVDTARQSLTAGSQQMAGEMLERVTSKRDR